MKLALTITALLALSVLALKESPAPTPALWVAPQPDRMIARPHSSAMDWSSYLLSRDFLMAQGSDTIAAFYGAKGWGALAFSKADGVDCRSLPLQVLFVTATGGASGNFKDIIQNKASSDSFTFVIFRTGGTADDGNVTVRNGRCLYIAGQTAPGGGYQQVRASGSGVFTIWYKEGTRRSLVVRYMRFRSAESQTCTFTTNNIMGGQFIIEDHVSTEYCCDSFLSNSPQSGWDSVTNITWQNDLWCGGLPRNGTAMEITFNEDDPPMRKVSIGRSYVCEYKHRGPRFAIEDSLAIQIKLRGEYVSNLNYNWWGSRAGSSQAAEVDFVKNLFVTGPGERSNAQLGYLRYVAVDETYGNPFDSLGTIYMSGNTNCGSTTPGVGDRCDGTQWWDYDLMHEWGTWILPLPSQYRRATPNPQPPIPIIPVDSAMWLLDSIPPLVGASQSLTCDGKWQYNRDELDSLMVYYVQADTGYAAQPASRSAYGGYPTLLPGTPCTDSDNDGMPNAFEVAMGYSDGTSLSPGGDCGGNGYLNIEEYVNGGLAEPGVFAWTDRSTNELGFIVSRWQSGSGWAVVDTTAPNVQSYTVTSWAVGDSFKVAAWLPSGQTPATSAPVTCP